MSTVSTPRPRRTRRPTGGLARMEQRWGVLLALPVVLGFLVFTIGPMLASFVISLTDWTIGGEVNWVGLDNYRQMFGDDALFGTSLRVTLSYTLMAVPLTLAVGFGVAMLLNRDVRGRGLFRVLYYLPVLVPSVASAVLWTWVYNPEFGLLNQLLRGAGLPTSRWIYDADTALPSLAIMAAWGFGNAAVIFLAGLQGVPRHLYEAIEMDGGGPWARFRYVTLPMMTPTIFYNLVMGLIATFQVFNEAYVMTQGGPDNATLFYNFYLYRTAFTEGRLGYASALAWVLFVVMVAVTALVFRSARRWVYYETGDGR
ncbi:carbohydrate ABC transporter permease [Streptomyces triticirhizae]|uniref:Sugar ABC transporter permease n=1 Tax=Streptomyces triticirhizae TaxID=2483353 RepID=A0A3M2M8S7_9ACTN|nr:sugar ABC transporter permease [Streptomyces triticirhizae]RMI44975.1 sugar ABC transporter permease [Streptomyces triticirhizae]